MPLHLLLLTDLPAVRPFRGFEKKIFLSLMHDDQDEISAEVLVSRALHRHLPVVCAELVQQYRVPRVLRSDTGRSYLDEVGETPENDLRQCLLDIYDKLPRFYVTTTRMSHWDFLDLLTDIQQTIEQRFRRDGVCLNSTRNNHNRDTFLNQFRSSYSSGQE